MHENDWNILRATVSSSDIWNIHGMIPWARSLGVPEPELEGFFEIASLGRDFFPRGLEPDIVLQGETNPVGDSGRLQAILTPGHSPGHICVYDRENKLFFSGDHILVEITPHISPSQLTSQDQLEQYLEALRKVRPMTVDLVLPAHERPFSHFRRRIDEILAHHDHRLAEVVACHIRPRRHAMGHRASSRLECGPVGRDGCHQPGAGCPGDTGTYPTPGASGAGGPRRE